MTPLLAQKPRADRGFERIYRRHLGDVYRYAVAVLRNPADAEDVTQTTFLNAYRAYERGERPRNAQNWLIAIAHNVCRQRFRQQQRRPDEIAYEDGIGEVVPEEESGPSVEDIQRALGHLAFNQRAALVMRELEGRSYAEIAEILGLSVSAVETLIFRARRALREQLDGSLTCVEAERAISLQVDGKLARAERGPLRAHLRECAECERLARSQRAQRNAWKGLAAIPIPTSLSSLFGGGGTAVGVGLGAKAAAVVAAGAVATGIGVEGKRLVDRTGTPSAVPAASAAAVAGDGANTGAATAGRSAGPARVVARPTARRAEATDATAPVAKPAPGQAKRAAKPSPPGRAKKQAEAVVVADSPKSSPPGRAKAATRRKPPRSTPARGTPTSRSKPKRQPPAQSESPKGSSEAPKQDPAAGKRTVTVPELPVPVPVPVAVPTPPAPPVELP